jgi:hypothetical protein
MHVYNIVGVRGEERLEIDRKKLGLYRKCGNSEEGICITDL